MNEVLVKSWITAKAKVDSAKEFELSLRKEICDHILKDLKKGAKTESIGKYVLTATAKLNLKVDKEFLHSMWKELSKEEKSAIKFTPSIVAKEYATVDEKSMIHRAIESKPGTPTLTLKSVKETFK